MRHLDVLRGDLRFAARATQGDNFEELLQNLYEAVEGCLSVGVQ